MSYYVPPGVQVRKESWGLVFYSQLKHKILFVKSTDLLYPHHFDGTWTFTAIAEDASDRTGNPLIPTEKAIRTCIDKLLDRGLVVHELR